MYTVFKKCLSSTYDFVMASAATVNQLGSYAHNPRGNLWFNDESSYGQKMLLKMGWSKGKGLGKKEDGITENIKVKFKNTNAGLGYKDDPFANIMKTEYESILKDLSTEYSKQKTAKSSNKNKESKSKIKRKSKAIKRKIRYPKLFYGKDVSKYSEKDMKSIFICSFPIIDTEKEKVKADISEPCHTTETVKESSESNTYSSQLSISDYFALKKKEKKDNELKKCLSGEIKPTNTDSQCNEFENSDPVLSEKKCKEKKKKSKLHIIENNEDPAAVDGKDKKSVTVLNEKQSISLQNIAIEDLIKEKMQEKSESNENNQSRARRKKRKKLLKEKLCSLNLDMLSSHPNDMHENILNSPCKKRKKSYKNLNKEAADSVELLSVCPLEHEISEKCEEIDISSSDSTVKSSPESKSEKCGEIDISPSDSAAKSSSAIKSETHKTDNISCTGSVNESSCSSNKHTIKEKTLKNELNKLKSCLKSRKNKYTIKNEKNVSFNENISYRVFHSNQDVIDELPDLELTLDDFNYIEYSDYLYLAEKKKRILMKSYLKFYEERRGQGKNSDSNTLNVQGNSTKKKSNTLSVSDSSTSKKTNTPNVPNSSTNKQNNTLHVPDNSTTKQIKNKHKCEFRKASGGEPVEVCNSPTDLPSSNSSHYNAWIESQKLALKMKMYKNMLKCIKTHDVLKTTNLSSIKGYGNWGF